mmetsp:Transcript_67632/g.133472  ORF Transcript_67632/g.133472 Transcript_67632/m.133472 type:complete len:151 (-) Transcript_67632:150-602(-)
MRAMLLIFSDILPLKLYGRGCVVVCPTPTDAAPGSFALKQRTVFVNVDFPEPTRPMTAQFNTCKLSQFGEGYISASDVPCCGAWHGGLTAPVCAKTWIKYARPADAETNPAPRPTIAANEPNPDAPTPAPATTPELTAGNQLEATEPKPQ